MSNKILFPLLSVILLACSITSPFTAARPITQVVFRSPRDMNLQPQDVPEVLKIMGGCCNSQAPIFRYANAEDVRIWTGKPRPGE